MKWADYPSITEQAAMQSAIRQVANSELVLIVTLKMLDLGRVVEGFQAFTQVRREPVHLPQPNSIVHSMECLSGGQTNHNPVSTAAAVAEGRSSSAVTEPRPYTRPTASKQTAATITGQQFSWVAAGDLRHLGPGTVCEATVLPSDRSLATIFTQAAAK